jgi:hypothetical protein
MIIKGKVVPEDWCCLTLKSFQINAKESATFCTLFGFLWNDETM